jgi:hypothetical protein
MTAVYSEIQSDQLSQGRAATIHRDGPVVPTHWVTYHQDLVVRPGLTLVRPGLRSGPGYHGNGSMVPVQRCSQPSDIDCPVEPKIRSQQPPDPVGQTGV